MSTDLKSKGTAVVLAGIGGVFGADKFYVGATGAGVAQLLLTLTFFGLLISGPWAFISTLTLVLMVLMGSKTFLYPKVDWAPTTKNDTIIAWVVVGLYVIGILSALLTRNKQSDSSDSYEHKKKSISKENKSYI